MPEPSPNETYKLSETDKDLSLVGKPGPKLNVGIVGYGPSGILTAIGLSKLGH